MTMKRYVGFLLAIGLVALPAMAGAQYDRLLNPIWGTYPSGFWSDQNPISVISTADGIDWKMGITEQPVPMFIHGLDLLDDFNFRQVTVFDVGAGNNNIAFWNVTTLMFAASKGPVRAYTMFKFEASIDEQAIDVLFSPNLERASLTWKSPLGDLWAGYDVRVLDLVSGITYVDEQPGVWLVGSRGPWGWHIGWILQHNSNRAKYGTYGLGPNFVTFPQLSDISNNSFYGQLSYTGKFPTGYVTLVPMLMVELWRSPQPAGNVFTCPLTEPVCDVPGWPTTTIPSGLVDPRNGSEINKFYPSLEVRSKFGPLMFSAIGVGLLGTARNLMPGAYAVSDANPGGIGCEKALGCTNDEFDLRSWYVFGEFALDLSRVAPTMAGITPFVNVEVFSGDDDPFDDKLGGFTPHSQGQEVIYKQGCYIECIVSLAPPIYFSTSGGFGVTPNRRGIGPTTGDDLEDIVLASSIFLGPRDGKADGPGYWRISGGIVGKINPRVSMHLTASYFRAMEDAPLRAEAAAAALAQFGPAGFATLAGLSAAPASCVVPTVTANCLKDAHNAIDISKDMGAAVNLQFRYGVTPHFSISPFVSFFIPGQEAEDLGRFFVGSDDTETAIVGGVEFLAQF